MKLLMHICCAPCANMPIDALRAEGVELTGYWYNPNIHPFTEYRARRSCLQEYAKTIDLPLLVRDDYGLRPFVREVAEDIAGRCVKCYEMRLFEAARAAGDVTHQLMLLVGADEQRRGKRIEAALLCHARRLKKPHLIALDAAPGDIVRNRADKRTQAIIIAHEKRKIDRLRVLL